MANFFKRTGAFRRAMRRASKIASNKESISKVLINTEGKIGSIDGLKSEMRSFLDKVATFIRMIRSYLKGTYQELPTRTLILMIGGLIYFIMPVDFFPDFIPGIGLIDDVSIILAIFKSVADDVSAFEQFESGETKSAEEAVDEPIEIN